MESRLSCGKNSTYDSFPQTNAPHDSLPQESGTNGQDKT